MTWHKIELSTDEVKAGEESRILKEFTDLFVAAGGPRDAAMLSSSLNSPGATIYLSPGAIRIAPTLVAAHAGLPCDCPSGSVVLLLGHGNATEELLG